MTDKYAYLGPLNFTSNLGIFPLLEATPPTHHSNDEAIDPRHITVGELGSVASDKVYVKRLITLYIINVALRVYLRSNFMLTSKLNMHRGFTR
jgi:hypothetical protein